MEIESDNKSSGQEGNEKCSTCSIYVFSGLGQKEVDFGLCFSDLGFCYLWSNDEVALKYFQLYSSSKV